jgi:hypothetical protein
LFLILSRIIKRVFYIGTLSCAPLLIANLSFYSSSVLPTNPSLRSETHPHFVSVCVGVPDSTVPRLSTPDAWVLIEPHPSAPAAASQLQSALLCRRHVQTTPPPTTSWSAALSLAHLGTRKPQPRHQFLTGTGRPLHRAASPLGHTRRRQLLTASMRPRRRSESSLRISSPCPIHCCLSSSPPELPSPTLVQPALRQPTVNPGPARAPFAALSKPLLYRASSGLRGSIDRQASSTARAPTAGLPLAAQTLPLQRRSNSPWRQPHSFRQVVELFPLVCVCVLATNCGGLYMLNNMLWIVYQIVSIKFGGRFVLATNMWCIIC